jgi:predicted RND superfamily exporter protein
MNSSHRAGSVPPNDSETGLLGRLADWLIRWKGTLLLVALAATLAAIPVAARLRLDERIESFFAVDDPLLLAYQDSKAWFKGDEFVLVAYEVPQPEGESDDSAAGQVETGSDEAGGEGLTGIEQAVANTTSNEHLTKLKEFAAQLSAVPGIVPESTQTLEGLLHPRFGTTPIDRILARIYARMNQDAILDFGEHLLISTDRKTVEIILRLAPETETGPSRRETYRRIRELAAAHDPPAAVAGEPIQVHDMFRYVEQDSRLLGWVSTLLLLVLILVLFRSLRWVALPLLVVHVTLVWTKAVLAASGLRLSMVSSMLTSLVTIIGVATVMHVTLVFRDWRQRADRPRAFREMFIELCPPVAWTSLTTALGFFALMSSSITPVRSFGLMLGLASLMLLPVAALLLPGGILIGGLDCDPRPAPAEGTLLRWLERLCHGLERHPRALLAGMIALMVASGSGLWFTQVETDFSKNFRESSEIVQALEFFETKLGGVGNWEVHFPAPPELTDEALEPVRELATALRQVETDDGIRLTKVVALSDGIDFAPGSNLDQKLTRLNAIQPEFVESLYDAKAGRMRIVLRALERQPAEVKLRLIDEVTATARRFYPEARTTGLYVLLANLISSLQRDQLVSSLLAAAGVFGCIAIMHRSVWLGFVSLFPNVFPLMLVLGGMGWAGIPVNIGTAMIASVSMGMTDDSSIHYLREYIHDRKTGAGHLQAMHAAHSTVGPALVFATLILVAGFLVLALSNFIPLVYFGVLVALSMLGGLLGGLILLPLLLKWVPVKSTKTVQEPAAEGESPAEEPATVVAARPEG